MSDESDDRDLYYDDLYDEPNQEEENPITQSGGKLLGDGMYGCVFSTSLKCASNTIVSVKGAASSATDKRVSKLVDSESAYIEFKLSKFISQIPLWRNYFVISESICEPAKQQTEPDLAKCDPLQKEDISQFKILYMPNRGDSLHLHRFSLTQFDFMKFAKHMIEAGALMNLFHIVHRDLHQGNVLVDPQHVPRIIDFNLSFHALQKVTAAALSHHFDPIIAHEPPDSALVNAIYQKESYRKDYDYVIQRIIDKKSILKRIRTLLGGSYDGHRAELQEFYETSKSAKSGDTASWFRMYWSKIDSWAIGVILVDLITQFHNYTHFRTKYATIKPILEPILRDMCQINPIKRIDCVKALQRLDPSHFILRKYGSTWLKHLE